MRNDAILIIDFGGQYNQLIARRVRECNVYCEVIPYTADMDRIRSYSPKGIIFTGGPASVYEDNAPKCSPEVFEMNVPVLGICYGMQMMAQMLGGKVNKSEKKEYGNVNVKFNSNSKLYKDIDEESTCWMSHTNYVEAVPAGFVVSAATDNCPTASMECADKGFYGVQFHPEVLHTPCGINILHNFLFDVCGCSGDWKMSDFAQKSVEELKAKLGNDKVLLALSGGVDSSVCAAMISKAVGKNLTCIFVDHGLLRKHEKKQVQEVFTKQFDVNLITVDARKRFLDKLAGVTEPEKKRKIIGEEFIRVFEEEAKKLGKVDYLVQGTIYPDIIESGLGDAAVIKSHHNVGGLPELINFKEIVEPLRDLFKDEVRQVGLALGLPEFLVYRQPFPGPGLAVRVIGDITEFKLNILRDADYIFREEIANAGLDRSINQYFAILTGMRSVGVMGDERTYDYTIALRAVTTTDFMTADWAKIPYDVLSRVSNRIVNEVKYVNRIVYDITTKPPATIEWE